VEKDDPLYGTQYPQGFINLRRARYDLRTSTAPSVPREQLTLPSAWLDASVIYGDVKAVADALRSFEGGRLRESRPGFPARNTLGLPIFNQPPPRYHELRDARRQYLLGGPGVVENPVLMSIAILWFRNHNYHADRLAQLHPTWSDEELFFEARKWVTAEQQKITYYDWLPAFLGREVNAYNGYDRSVDPRISHVFQSAAQRWGHTLVTPGVYRRNQTCYFRPEANGKLAFRMCNSYFEPNDVLDEYDTSIEELWMGMCSQKTEREDNIITPDLRGFVFGPLEASRRDLMAINIQRSRDHGLPTYNVARAAFGLPVATHFENITSNATMAQVLSDVHGGDISTVDIWTGGLLETTDSPGPLFSAVMLDQWTRIRDGDRFWFENRNNSLFTEDEIATVFNTTFKDLIVRLSRNQISEDDIQDDVFHFNAGDPCPMPKPLAEEDVDECTEAKTFDFYSTSEWDITIFLCCTIFISIFLIALVFFIIARRKANEAKVHAEHYNQAHEHGDIAGVHRAYATMAFDHAGPVSKPANREGAWGAVVLRPGGAAFAAYLKYDSSDAALEVHSAEKLSSAAAAPGADTELRNVPLGLIHAVAEDSLHTHGVLLLPEDGMRPLWVVLDGEGAQALLQSVHKAAPHTPIRAANPDEMHRLAAKAEDQYLESVGAFMDTTVASINNDIAERQASKTGRGTQSKHHHRPGHGSHHIPGANRKSLRRVGKAFGSGGVSMRRHLGGRKSTRGHRASAEALASGEEPFTLELDLELFSSLLGVPPSAPVAQRLYAFISRNSRAEGGGDRLDSASVHAALAVILSHDPESKMEALFHMYANEGVLYQSNLADLLREMAHWGGADDSAALAEAVRDVAAQAAGEAGTGLNLKTFKSMVVSHPVLRIALESNGFGWAHGNLLKKYEEKVVEGQQRRSPDLASRNKRFGSKIGRNLSTKSRPQAASMKGGAEEAEDGLLDGVRAWAQRQYHYMVDHRREVGFLFFFFATTALIFLERYWNYSEQRLHGGLRAIVNRGVAVTRGGASAMMWTFSLAMLPMCRNLMTALRSTFLIHVIPFDQAIAFHKIAALTGGLFVIVHITGHVTNFYKIATTPAANMMCAFREVYWYSDWLPRFSWWIFKTVTGVTGYILLLVTIIIFVFASPWSRRFDFNLFWTTHQLYVLFYALLIAHGAAHLVQQPIFWQYFIGPLFLYTIDKLVTLATSSHKLEVKEAQILPAGVVGLFFEKPPGFNEAAGQWLRIRISEVASHEWHPFTISSAPHENFISVHIRGVGPWTRKCREVYREALDRGDPLPPVHIQGPYGEGYQEWDQPDVAVLVGAGIGVTPFVSIVKEYGERLRRAKATGQTAAEVGLPYVYFLWVAKTQRQYEWLVEICKEVQALDTENRLEVHLFLTANTRQADFRTAVARALDREHYEKTGVSLLTGMRGIQHAGRPNFAKILTNLREVHPAELLRVYSCGPPKMRDNIEAARHEINKDLPVSDHIEHVSSYFYA
jgi:predicted ferric reductase